MAPLEEACDPVTSPPASRRTVDDDRPRANATGTISVIVPTLNEQAALPATLDRLGGAEVEEVIIVDGGSVDETVPIAHRSGARVEMCPPGRGRQMNAGARVARGDILLFLHADTRLPDRFDALIRTTLLNQPEVAAGAFTLQIDAPGRFFRTIERAATWRSKRWQAPYGDQAIFLSASTFHAVGGFPDWPLLEDVELMRRVRAAGSIVILSEPAVTSARRWRRRGVWRTTLLNQAILVAYRLGVSPERLARLRGLEHG